MAHGLLQQKRCVWEHGGHGGGAAEGTGGIVRPERDKSRRGCCVVRGEESEGPGRPIGVNMAAAEAYYYRLLRHILLSCILTITDRELPRGLCSRFVAELGFDCSGFRLGTSRYKSSVANGQRQFGYATRGSYGLGPKNGEIESNIFRTVTLHKTLPFRPFVCRTTAMAVYGTTVGRKSIDCAMQCIDQRRTFATKNTVSLGRRKMRCSLQETCKASDRRGGKGQIVANSAGHSRRFGIQSRLRRHLLVLPFRHCSWRPASCCSAL